MNKKFIVDMSILKDAQPQWYSGKFQFIVTRQFHCYILAWQRLKHLTLSMLLKMRSGSLSDTAGDIVTTESYSVVCIQGQKHSIWFTYRCLYLEKLWWMCTWKNTSVFIMGSFIIKQYLNKTCQIGWVTAKSLPMKICLKSLKQGEHTS